MCKVCGQFGIYTCSILIGLACQVRLLFSCRITVTQWGIVPIKTMMHRKIILKESVSAQPELLNPRLVYIYCSFFKPHDACVSLLTPHHTFLFHSTPPHSLTHSTPPHHTPPSLSHCIPPNLLCSFPQRNPISEHCRQRDVGGATLIPKSHGIYYLKFRPQPQTSWTHRYIQYDTNITFPSLFSSRYLDFLSICRPLLSLSSPLLSFHLPFSLSFLYSGLLFVTFSLSSFSPAVSFSPLFSCISLCINFFTHPYAPSHTLFLSHYLVYPSLHSPGALSGRASYASSCGVIQDYNLELYLTRGTGPFRGAVLAAGAVLHITDGIVLWKIVWGRRPSQPQIFGYP